jgi:hypothetical protein
MLTLGVSGCTLPQSLREVIRRPRGEAQGTTRGRTVLIVMNNRAYYRRVCLPASATACLVPFLA